MPNKLGRKYRKTANGAMSDYLQGIEYKDGKLYFAPPGFGHDISSGAKYNTAKPAKLCLIT